jgi:hypothetical protein
MASPTYLEALQRLDLLAALARFDPHVAGTPPLGLEMPGSDIDVLCHVVDADAFTRTVWDFASNHEQFAIHQWTRDARPVVASFKAHGWPIEIFGASRPVVQQAGWRHFTVERRLLALGGDAFRTAVMGRRRGGLKTEPAFAAVLGLAGDPYSALLDVEARSDIDLLRLLNGRGFAVTVAATSTGGEA